MPVGQFLDSFPDVLFIAAHILFLAVGLWAIQRTRARGLPYAPALVLYALSQVGFLAVFAHLLTLKLGVLVDQTLMVAMIVSLVLLSSRGERRAA